MTGILRKEIPSRRTHAVLLMAVWFCALLAGSVAARVLRIQMRPAFSTDSTWFRIGRLLGQVLFFAVVQWAFPAGIPVAAFCGGGILAYTAQGIRTGFGNAGWLFWPMFLFSELLISPFLFFAWLQPHGRRCRNAYLLAAAAAVVIGLADLRLVIPFGAFLIE